MGEAERVNSPRDISHISVAHTEAGKFWEMRFRGRILRENRETLRFASRIYMRVAYVPVAIAQWAASGACPPRQNQILFSALLNWSHPHSDTSFVVFGVRLTQIAKSHADNPPSTCDGFSETCPKRPISHPPPTSAGATTSQPLGRPTGAPSLLPLASGPTRSQLWEALN